MILGGVGWVLWAWFNPFKTVRGVVGYLHASADAMEHTLYGAIVFVVGLLLCRIGAAQKVVRNNKETPAVVPVPELERPAISQEEEDAGNLLLDQSEQRCEKPKPDNHL
jgi:hypothetical protein